MPQKTEKFSFVILDDDREDWIPGFKRLLEKEFSGADIEHYKDPHAFFNLQDFEVAADIVFLDVVGMEPWIPEIAIPTIRRRWPKLPIVMLSKKRELSDALDYFVLGARGYVIKDVDTAQNVKMMFGNVAHEAELAKDWKKIVSLIRFLVNEYRPIKRILNDKRDIGWVKKEKTGDESILPDQIDFLEYVEQRNDPVLNQRFPQILRKHNESYYVIPFYRAKSLRRILFELDDSDKMVETAQVVLTLVLTELKTRLFDFRATSLTQDKWERYIDDYYLGKLQRRQNELRQLLKGSGATTSNAELLTRIDKAEEKFAQLTKIKDKKGNNEIVGLLQDVRELLISPSFQSQRGALTQVLEAKRLRIRGKNLKPPLDILKAFLKNKDGKRRFLPEKIGRIHGDLHFDNILVGPEVPEKPFIKLIDPRGFRKGADFAYDIGKLLHSCHGKYDMIDDGHYSIQDKSGLVSTRSGTRTVSGLEKVEWVQETQGGGSRDTVTSYGKKIKEEHYLAFDRIEAWLVNDVLPALLPEDPELKSRSYLNEALHFCTMGPFHLERNPLKALTLYVRGVQLINELSEDLGYEA